MSITNRNLRIGITGGLDITYYRTDLPITTKGATASFNYTELKKILTHGSGGNKCDLLHFSTRNLNNEVEVIDLNGGLSNIWGDQLNYNSVKVIVIRNRETDLGKFLQARFKNDLYYIGPGGYRLIVEPQGQGVSPIESSESSEEGSLIFSTDTDIQFDLIVGGSSEESSSSSGA
jgi:hypothetical protein